MRGIWLSVTLRSRPWAGVSKGDGPWPCILRDGRAKTRGLLRMTVSCLFRAARPAALQRLDLHRTELHDAGAVLQPDAAARVLAVLDAVDGFLAVERHGELRALGDDLVGVPFVRRLGHGRHLGNVDDRAGAESRVRTLVENV